MKPMRLKSVSKYLFKTALKTLAKYFIVRFENCFAHCVEPQLFA